MINTHYYVKHDEKQSTDCIGLLNASNNTTDVKNNCMKRAAHTSHPLYYICDKECTYMTTDDKKMCLLEKWCSLVVIKHASDSCGDKIHLLCEYCDCNY